MDGFKDLRDRKLGKFVGALHEENKFGCCLFSVHL